MQATVEFGTRWLPDEKTIDTRICGPATFEDIECWEESLYKALSLIEDNRAFKILVDLFGFDAINIAAHKRFRTVVPVTLSLFGWKVGYTDLFMEESQLIQYSNTRGIRCTAAAHVHHDETKIGLYERSYSRSDERYFNDPEEARTWLHLLSVE